jgi:hypothetical protein
MEKHYYAIQNESVKQEPITTKHYFYLASLVGIYLLSAYLEAYYLV